MREAIHTEMYNEEIFDKAEMRVVSENENCAVLCRALKDPVPYINTGFLSGHEIYMRVSFSLPRYYTIDSEISRNSNTSVYNVDSWNYYKGCTNCTCAHVWQSEFINYWCKKLTNR